MTAVNGTTYNIPVAMSPTMSPMGISPYGPPPIGEERFVLEMLADDPERALLLMGIEPPSQATNTAKHAAIWGGAGLAAGLGLAILPGIGPIASAIGGALGAIGGGIYGFVDHDRKERIYHEKARLVQSAARRMLQMPEASRFNETLGMKSGSVDEMIDRIFAKHDPDATGSVEVATATGHGAKLLRHADTEGDKDGAATRSEVNAIFSEHDANNDGSINGFESLTLQARIMASDMEHRTATLGASADETVDATEDTSDPLEDAEQTSEEADDADASGDGETTDGEAATGDEDASSDDDASDEAEQVVLTPEPAPTS